MRTFALTMILLAGFAFAAFAEDGAAEGSKDSAKDGCDCTKTEKIEIQKVEIQKIEVQAPNDGDKPTKKRNHDHFRIGITGTSELAEQADFFDYFKDAFSNADLYPGIFWELRLGHFGFGMTALGRFTFDDTSIPYGQRTWLFDVLGSIDARYHLLTGSFIDPFIEVGVGASGKATMAPIDSGARADMLGASMFAQAGGGLGLNFSQFHVGAKFMYRFFQDAIPGVDLPADPVSMFQLSLYAGVSLF